MLQLLRNFVPRPPTWALQCKVPLGDFLPQAPTFGPPAKFIKSSSVPNNRSLHAPATAIVGYANMGVQTGDWAGHVFSFTWQTAFLKLMQIPLSLRELKRVGQACLSAPMIPNCRPSTLTCWKLPTV